MWVFYVLLLFRPAVKLVHVCFLWLCLYLFSSKRVLYSFCCPSDSLFLCSYLSSSIASRRKTLHLPLWRLQQTLLQLQRPLQTHAHPLRWQALLLQDGRLPEALHRPQLATQAHQGARALCCPGARRSEQAGDGSGPPRAPEHRRPATCKRNPHHHPRGCCGSSRRPWDLFASLCFLPCQSAGPPRGATLLRGWRRRRQDGAARPRRLSSVALWTFSGVDVRPGSSERSGTDGGQGDGGRGGGGWGRGGGSAEPVCWGGVQARRPSVLGGCSAEGPPPQTSCCQLEWNSASNRTRERVCFLHVCMNVCPCVCVCVCVCVCAHSHTCRIMVSVCVCVHVRDQRSPAEP